MTPIEMAEAMEGRARVRRKITNRENIGDRLSDQLEQAATMLRNQQALIENLNGRIERMIENASHHEGIAHAGGFEAGWQAAKRTPLSDQELLKMAADKFHYTEYKLAIEFARAIERAHGIGELP